MAAAGAARRAGRRVGRSRQRQMADELEWLAAYFERYQVALFSANVRPALVQFSELARATHAAGRKVIFAGNGGSAALASHCAVDFTKQAGVRGVNFNEPDLITCLANDYGYEHWLRKALEFYADAGDLVVLVSSSGASRNMVNAGRHALDHGLPLVTFTGFAADNPLRRLGSLNFWVDSRTYNIVEMTHHIWLLAACDLLVGRAKYPEAAQGAGHVARC